MGHIITSNNVVEILFPHDRDVSFDIWRKMVAQMIYPKLG